MWRLEVNWRNYLNQIFKNKKNDEKKKKKIKKGGLNSLSNFIDENTKLIIIDPVLESKKDGKVEIFGQKFQDFNYNLENVKYTVVILGLDLKMLLDGLHILVFLKKIN